MSCPFYGYHAALGYLIPSHGNQCGLIAGAFSPCLFDIDGKPPNWKDCPRNDHSAHARLIATFEILEPHK